MARAISSSCQLTSFVNQNLCGGRYPRIQFVEGVVRRFPSESRLFAVRCRPNTSFASRPVSNVRDSCVGLSAKHGAHGVRLRAFGPDNATEDRAQRQRSSDHSRMIRSRKARLLFVGLVDFLQWSQGATSDRARRARSTFRPLRCRRRRRRTEFPAQAADRSKN